MGRALGIPSGASASSSAIYTQEVPVLHGAVTNITPTYPPALGSLLFIVLTQDGTGGGQITWSSQFKYVTVNDIGINPNDVSILLFFGRLDPATSTVKWFMGLGAPLLGAQ